MANTARVSIALLIALTFLAAAPVRASALWWSKTEVHVSSEPKCMQLAFSVAREKLQGVRRSNEEVSGTRTGVYVSITCIGRGTGTPIAMVMAMGDSDQGTRAVRDDVVRGLEGARFID
jgi:hypothetical protein